MTLAQMIWLGCVYLAIHLPLFALYWLTTPSPHDDGQILVMVLIIIAVSNYLARRLTKRWPDPPLKL